MRAHAQKRAHALGTDLGNRILLTSMLFWCFLSHYSSSGRRLDVRAAWVTWVCPPMGARTRKTQAHTAACAGSGRARHHDEDDYGVYDHYGDVTMMMMMMMSRSPPTCGPVATVASGRATGHARRTCTDARRTR